MTTPSSALVVRTSTPINLSGNIVRHRADSTSLNGQGRVYVPLAGSNDVNVNRLEYLKRNLERHIAAHDYRGEAYAWREYFPSVKGFEKSKYQALEQRHHALEGQMQLLQSELAELDYQKGIMEAALEDKNKLLSTCIQSARELTQKETTLLNQLQVTRQQHVAMQDTVDTLTRERDNAVQTQEQVSLSKNELERQLKMLNKDRDSLASRLNSYLQERTTLQEEIATLKRDAAQMQESHARLKTTHIAIKSRRKKQQEEHTKAIAALQLQLLEKDEALETHKRKANTLEEALDLEQQAHLATKIKLEHHQKIFQHLRAELDDLSPPKTDP